MQVICYVYSSTFRFIVVNHHDIYWQKNEINNYGKYNKRDNSW